MDRTLDVIDRWLNPILVKDIYQGFRSKSFLGWYGLALFVCLNAYLFVPLTIADYKAEQTGNILFAFLYTCLALVAGLIVPFSIGRQLRDEIENNTMDLIAITHLTPKEVLVGRFQAAMLKIILLCAYFGPFVSIAFLYGGIGVFHILFLLMALLIVVSIILASSLMLNALVMVVGHNLVNRFLSPAFFLGVATTAPFMIAGWAYYMRRGISAAWSDQWPLLLWAVVMVFLACRFLLSLGEQFLTPMSLRDSRYPKKWLLLLSLGALCAFGLSAWAHSGVGRVQKDLSIIIMSNLLWVWWLVAFWMGQTKHMPQRLESKLQNLGRVRRWLYSLLGDGYYYSLRYYIILSIILLTPFMIAEGEMDVIIIWLFSIVYLIYFSGIACFMVNFFRDSATTYAYIITFMILMVLEIFLSAMMQSTNLVRDYTWLLVFFPLDEDLKNNYPYYLVWLPIVAGGVFAYLGRRQARKYAST